MPEHVAETGVTRRSVIFAITIGALFIALLIPVVALTFSVRVKGDSMDPTLSPGDRLLFNIFSRSTPQRFDLVDANLVVQGTAAVKRVIGLPGDRISIRFNARVPVVEITPAGTTKAYRVDNPVWLKQLDANADACCEANGTRSPEPQVVTIPKGSYWVLGDNWGGSDDSRRYGFVTADRINAGLNFRLLPVSKFGRVPTPARLVPLS